MGGGGGVGGVCSGRKKEQNALFNDALNTFLCTVILRRWTYYGSGSLGL